jgi:hypothetical protein
VLAIGVLHTLVGLAIFRSTLADLAAEGFVNSLRGHPVRELAFWFLFFGLVVLLLGALVDWCEQRDVPLPAFLGLGRLVLAVVCVTFIPVSGGWLLLVPAVGALLQSRAATRLARA